MNQPIYIVDAFTCQPYRGNPAAVCLLEQPGDVAWMQSVATEMNLSDTAFLVPKEEGEWELRWFTPKVEVALCGHATLASAHILWNERGSHLSSLSFHSASGLLTAQKEQDWICLDFPKDHLTPIDLEPSLTNTLGCEPNALYRGREDLLAVFNTPQQVRNLAPDQASLKLTPCRGLIATAPGDRPGVDFISRFFAPALGIAEDPVTGSAHCTLAPYWGERLGKQTLHAHQVSARGGELGIHLNGERVSLLGQATTIMAGHLYV
jgi:PhzF family phenazine biosynthesis protein